MLPAIVLMPWLAIALLAVNTRGPRNLAVWIAGLADLLALALLLALKGEILTGAVLRTSLPWVPSLGLNLSLRLDGLSFLFALLILAIGALVVLYARYYLSEERRLDRFYGLLMLFTGAMLGLVMSENMLLMFVFWELTSLSSFLLVGYWHGKASAREGARTALAVTGGGGLALLAGIIALGQITGSYELSDILAARELVQSSDRYNLIVVLFLLGAFTKSAQFPFHFWLPSAMAAPTPVSAYLHSATMVKAGVFLLARVYPVLSGPDLWFYTLTGIGLITLVFGAYQAMFRHDLKGLLAYSTVSHLGLITLLLGIGTPLSAVAALFHVINHATFKASLFMAAGIIDHECGTRDMRRINGLWRYMPVTGLLAMVAAASMAGVPLVNGFLSKEMFFGEALELERGGGLQWIVPLVAVMGSVFSVAYSLRFIHDVFFLDRPLRTPRTPHEPPRWMRVPVDVLVAVCLLVGLFPSYSVEGLLQASARAVLGTPPPEFSLALWHGVNLPLVMSAVAFAGGVLLYFLVQYGFDLHAHLPGRHLIKRGFDRALRGLSRLADGLAERVYGSGLSGSSLALITTVLMAGLFPFFATPIKVSAVSSTPVDAMALSLFGLMCAGAIGTVFAHRHRLAAVVVLSVVGLGVSMIFVYFSAPDLALTQLSVETVSILLLLLALNYLPQRVPRDIRLDRALRHFLLAGIAGGGAGWLTWVMVSRPFASISDYFVANAVPQGGGRNVVNVILVDFRAFDTYGEITVIAVAALGIAAMLSALNLPRRARDEAGRPWASAQIHLLLDLLARLLLPLALLVSLHLFLRGHNSPGGGFVAGLVSAVALVLLFLGSGLAWTQARLRIRYVSAAVFGLLVAGGTGIGAMLFGAPFLTSHYSYLDVPLLGAVPLASAMLFDLGVYLAVVGSVLLVLTLLGAAGRVAGKD
ncbi:MAG TPA: monovalent cation/H+ antiporter subunit A [Burkholderiales bacterium]|nr:monovalent cation/H+ antiporter subunit A [Burkholderiales bacterium]